MIHCHGLWYGFPKFNINIYPSGVTYIHPEYTICTTICTTLQRSFIVYTLGLPPMRSHPGKRIMTKYSVKGGTITYAEKATGYTGESDLAGENDHNKPKSFQRVQDCCGIKAGWCSCLSIIELSRRNIYQGSPNPG